MQLRQCINIEDLRQQAKHRLPKMVFDFLDGGAESESGLALNADAFSQWQFIPRRLVDVSHRQLTKTDAHGKPAFPVGLAPTGLNGVIWPQGDLHLARAAQRQGMSFALSTASNLGLEDLAQAVPDGDHWFQLYIVHRELAKRLVEKALHAGYQTLVVTVDVPLNGKRERDLRSGFGLPFRYTPRIIHDVLTHPRWALDMLRHGTPQMANFQSVDANNVELQAALLSRQMDASFDWQALQWLRDLWPHRLLVKGILHPDDAVQCLTCGADGVIVSNHGGRQLDHAVSALQALPAIRARVGSSSVYLDGGVRRGADIIKALALGATGVLLGRATLYGLACAGQAGVEHAISILRSEMDTTLANLGCPSLDKLDSGFLQPRFA